ncbi:PRP3-domain-containing protein [Schizopora paradoxa]|uniref:PRP3-domain-containing protein n=1 Tax=Schizopora paradoxa TaxID=27342 RepID=A0A0H2RAS5_9AGAM|nr:PRP3-domain-containing protein [Schizopora paradoxa]
MNKRPHENGADDLAAKRLKRLITLLIVWTASNGSKPGGLTSQEEIKRKQAEIAAKLAAMTGKKVSFPSLAPQAAASSSAAPPIVAPQPTSAPSVAEELARRVAEAKRRVAEMSVNANPYLATIQAGKKKAPAPEPAPQGAGLKMAAHPLLLDTSSPAPQSKKDRYKPMVPKFASIKANIRNTPASTPPPAQPSPVPVADTKANPYFAKDAASGSFEGAAPKERASRRFRFNQKGKYVQIANQVRREEQLEQLKQRIAESARKAGMDGEFEQVEKAIKRNPPPVAEWWDENLLPNKTYDDIDRSDEALSTLNIRTQNSPITLYIQHPIPIPPPGDKNKVELKPLMLTKKEQKKMRKQRRQAELQDKRDRVRMGLIPPDAPKVRLANLMKVLTTDAVQDPTRVEARVRREVAMRKHNHEKMNAERKLTDEQRREKIETKKVDEEKKGLVGAIFKVKTLVDPSHRFKVRKNAEQMNLSGLVIYHPSFSMVYVEGAAKFIRQYKKLMLNRVQWTVAARARGAEEVELEEGDNAGNQPFEVPSKDEEMRDDEYGTGTLEENRCDLVWEGQIRERVFKKFRPISCPTDSAAKEALGLKIGGYWDQAKNWKPIEEEMF